MDILRYFIDTEYFFTCQKEGVSVFWNSMCYLYGIGVYIKKTVNFVVKDIPNVPKERRLESSSLKPLSNDVRETK